jgi:hypothetical protein
MLADLKSAGHNCCTSAVQMVRGIPQNTPKRSSITLNPQQHTQNWVDLLSAHHPANQNSGSECECACRCHGQDRLSLNEPGCIFQEFFGNLAILFCDAPHRSCTFIDCIGGCAGCARSLGC